MATKRKPAGRAWRGNAAALAALLAFLCTLAFSAADYQKMESLAQERYGPEAADTVRAWRTTIDEASSKSEAQKLRDVNDFFNSRVRWVEDTAAWGERDYWATPLEVMGHAKGDCEDFAIAKYMSLLLAGIDISKLRITYVKTVYRGVNTAHMVLAYYQSPGADPAILDNIVQDIRPASQRKDLTPVFGFNSAGLWLAGAASPATTDPASRMSRWRGLLARAAAEGLG